MTDADGERRVGEVLLSCCGLQVGYGGQPLLPPIDFELRARQVCAVVGRNGAGKTTWFRTLLGLLPPVSGRVEHGISPLPMGYVPQRVALARLLPFCARDIVLMGLERGSSYLNPLLGRASRKRADRALEQMGALELACCCFGELSEGQKQKILMARLLAGGPRLAVLDEPMAGMDGVAEEQTARLVASLARDHDMGVLIISHNLSLIADVSDRMVFIDRAAQAVIQGSPRQVLKHPQFGRSYGPGVLNGWSSEGAS